MTDRYPPFRLDVGGSEDGHDVTMPPASPDPAERPPTTTSVADRPAGGEWNGGRILAVTAGALVSLVALGVLAAGAIGLWADTAGRENGFVTSPAAEFDADAYAVITDSFDVRIDRTDWVVPDAILGDARVTVSSDQPIFVGIARTVDIQRYLDGVSYASLPDMIRNNNHIRAGAGDAPYAPPTDQTFWVASSSGPGSQSVTWPITDGAWSIAVMNADGSKGLAFEGDVGAEAPVLRPIAIGLLIAGGVVFLIAIALITGAISRASRPRRSVR
jgi:hypothetical protein